MSDHRELQKNDVAGEVGLSWGGMRMLLDTTLLQEMRDRGELMKFECPELLELDVMELQPERIVWSQ